MKSPKDNRIGVAVIGGGASGLMCAITAAENGADVVLFEKNKSQKNLASESFYDNAYLGKKLLITGKGRCNVTNDCNLEEFMKNIPRNGKFLFSAYKAFSPQNVMTFFEDLGVPLKVERGNRVFPSSDKALDILFALKRKLKQTTCRVLNREIKSIEKEADFYVLTDSVNTVYTCEKVVICTGGKSYPVTGSTGDGYKFAKALGHTVTEIRPSLVPLLSDDIHIGMLRGLSLRNVTLSIYCDSEKKKKIFSDFGEMLFTHNGISGPLVLSASSHLDLSDDKKYYAMIDLKPALDEPTLDKRILSDFNKYINRDIQNALCELLPKSMILPVIERSGLSPHDKPNSISKQQRRALLEVLKGFRIDIKDYAPIDEAIITSGGIKASEINPSTMESKLSENLYFAGEVIDTHGYTGGFNLQIAFSTGYLAGKSCAKTKESDK